MIELIDVKSSNKVEEVKKLYESSFPKDEKLPFSILVSFSKKKNNDFYCILDDGQFVGLLNLILYKDIIFIFYIAVDNNLRSKGYGSKILDVLKEKYSNKRIILNIEKPNEIYQNNSQRIKRKYFYMNNSFQETKIILKERKTVYEMLCFNGEINKQEFLNMYKSLLNPLLYLIFKPKFLE